MEVVRYCSCTGGSGVCSSCGRTLRGSSRGSSSRAPLAMMPGRDEGEFEGQEIGIYYYILRLMAGILSGALTGLFALAGAFAGAVTGALAGRASNSGILRGSGLGAVAGAVLSVEILEASRAYWCSEQSGSRSSSSMADFMAELLHGRLVRERFVSTMFTDYRWQLSIANISYDEISDVYGEVASKGLSLESLNKLPCHVITDENKKGCSDSVCCTICLQDMEVGETVRSLRRCHHIFHLTCVDKWLVRHGSCPVCRQNV